MICKAVQEALSVRSDNELLVDPVLTDDEIDEHLASCAECQAFEKVSRRFTQVLRVDAVAEVPDIAGSVLEALPRKSPRVVRRRVGQAIVAVAAVSAVVAAGALQSGDVPTSDVALSPVVEDVAVPTTTTAAPVSEVSKVVVWSPKPLSDADTDRITSNDFVAKSSVAGLSSVDVVSESTASSTMEVLSFDPETYPEFVSEPISESFSTLGIAETVLSESAASSRSLGAGAMITLSTGDELLVTAVVPDAAMADADIALVNETANMLVGDRDTFILLDAQAETLEVEALLDSEDAESQLVVKNRTDDVSPRLAPKLLSDIDLVEDEAPDLDWLRANIRRSEVPILGEIQCHRDVIRAVTGAMTRLEARGLEALIDPEATIHCFDRHSSVEAGDHWHHNTGLAIDLNLVGDAPANIDRRLRNVMEQFGFYWGGNSLIPQPSHFEYVGPYIQGTPPPGENATLPGNEPAG